MQLMLENVEDALEQYRKEMDNVSRMSYQIIVPEGTCFC